jgi:hypothetical protein
MTGPILEICPDDGGPFSWDAEWGMWVCDTCSAEYSDGEVKPQRIDADRINDRVKALVDRWENSGDESLWGPAEQLRKLIDVGDSA